MEVLNNLSSIKETISPKEVEKINKVTVFLGEKMVVLSLDEIYYIEVAEKESLVYTKDEIYTSKLKISKWEEILPKINFIELTEHTLSILIKSKR